MEDKMYYDSFADEYVSVEEAEGNLFAPPERYLLTLRGDDNVYVETYEYGKEMLDIAYTETDIKLRQVNKIRFSVAKRCGWEAKFQTARMIRWFIPQEKFDRYYNEYIADKEGAEDG